MTNIDCGISFHVMRNHFGPQVPPGDERIAQHADGLGDSPVRRNLALFHSAPPGRDSVLPEHNGRLPDILLHAAHDHSQVLLSQVAGVLRPEELPPATAADDVQGAAAQVQHHEHVLSLSGRSGGLFD